MARWPAEGRAAAIAAELAPYAWRGFTDRMLARRAVGAADRQGLDAFLTSLPGTDVGVAEPVEPAPPGDERVDVLVRVVLLRHWRRQSLDRLCADLTAALDAWEDERDDFQRDLRNLLEER